MRYPNATPNHFHFDKCDIVGKTIRITKLPTTNTLKVAHKLFT